MENRTENATSPDTAARVIQEILPVVLQSVGIAGSAFLLCVLVARRRFMSMCWTVRFALCYLLTVDLLFLSFALYDDVHQDFTVKQSLVDQSAASCYLVVVTITTLISLQPYVQCIISVERVLAVGNPLRVRQIFTRRRMIYALTSASLLLFVLRVVYTVASFTYVAAGNGTGSCQIRGELRTPMLYIAIFDGLVFCAVPSFMLLVCTCLIICFLVRHRQFQSRHGRLSGADKRLCLVMVVMDVIFLLTSVPMIVGMFAKAANMNIMPKNYHKLPLRLTRLAAATDWLVLVCFSSQIRGVLRFLFCGRRRRTSQRDHLLLRRTTPRPQTVVWSIQ